MTSEDRHDTEEQFDIWLKRRRPPLTLRAEEFETARTIMRDDSSLRAPDALHLAVAQNLGLTLATLDLKLAGAARRAGVVISSL